MLCGQRLASAALALLLRFKLADPASDSTFAKIHVFTDLADAQALGFDHLSHLELEACVKDSSRFLGYSLLLPFRFEKTYRCGQPPCSSEEGGRKLRSGF